MEPCSLVGAKIRKNSSSYDCEVMEPTIFTLETCTGENISEKDVKTQNTCWMRYIGLVFAVLSSVLFSLCSLVIKTLKSYHALNISIFRFQGVLLPSILILICHWIKGNSSIVESIWPLSKPAARKNLFIVFLRGLLGAGGVVALSYSLQYLSLADSTVIAFSTPVFVTYLAHFILGEAMGIVPVLTSIFTLAGVVVITRPPMLSGVELSLDNLIGIGMALTCMLMQAGTLIVLRFLRDVNSTLITSGYGIIGTTVCFGIAMGCNVFELPQGRDDWIFAIALGALTFSAQVFYTLALQYEEAGPVSLIRSGDVIFAFIWQFLFLGAAADIFSVIGAIIVISGVLIIGLRKWVVGLPEGHKKKKLLWFMLL